MKIGKIVDYCSKYCIAIFMKRRLRKYDKKICAIHREWIGLDKYEMRAFKGSKYAYKAFKNIYGGELSRFVPDIIYQTEILPRLNFANYSKDGRYHSSTYFADKNYQDIFIENIKPLQCVIHNINGVYFNANFEIVSKNTALTLLNQYPELVYKKTIDTGHGKNVLLIKQEEYINLLNENNRDYIIQEVLKQHESLAYFNSSSVNVIRITTLFLKGEVYILGGVLRIGAPGAFCDHLAYGEYFPLVVAINENGKLGKRAIDCERGYVYDDVYGREIKGHILKYNEMKELVKKEHMKYPNHGIIGWDLTLDENGDIRCIEFNVRCPGVVQTQYALGPIFSQKAKSGRTFFDEIMNSR